MCFFYICLHSYYFQCFSFLLRNQRSAHFFCKRPKSLYLRLCGNWILVLPVLEWCCVAHNISRPCFLPCDGQWSLSSLAAAAAKLLQPCPTLCDPHRQQPTRLPRPWDSPGKNTGVGCHFLLQCMKMKSESEVAQSCRTLSDPMDCSAPGSSIHGISRQE